MKQMLGRIGFNTVVENCGLPQSGGNRGYAQSYVYVWVDGVYSNVRMGNRLCLMVKIGSDETGHQELLALFDGYRVNRQQAGRKC